MTDVHPASLAPAAPPRAPRLAPAIVAAILAVGPVSPGRAQDEAAPAPAGEVPTLEGTRDATVPPRRGDAGGAAQAPAALGTLSSWRAAEDRSAIRIGGEFGADELLGAPLVDREGRAVGTIEDLLVDTDGLVRKAMVRPAAPEAAGSRSAVVDLLELRKRSGGGGFVIDQVPRGMGQMPLAGPQDSPGSAGTEP